MLAKSAFLAVALWQLFALLNFWLTMFCQTTPMPSSPAVLPARFRHASGRAQAQTRLGLFALVFGSWLAVHLWALLAFTISARNWLLVLPIFALQCWLSVGLFSVAHGAMHGSLAPGLAQVTAMVGALLLLICAGFGWQKLRTAHFDHAGMSAQQPIRISMPAIRSTSQHFWAWCRLFLRRHFGWRSMACVGTVVLVYLTAFGALLKNIVLLYGLPAFASSLQLFCFGSYCPHRREGPASADHHRSPSVPWWGLPRQHAQWLQAQSGPR